MLGLRPGVAQNQLDAPTPIARGGIFFHRVGKLVNGTKTQSRVRDPFCINHAGPARPCVDSLNDRSLPILSAVAVRLGCQTAIAPASRTRASSLPARSSACRSSLPPTWV